MQSVWSDTGAPPVFPSLGTNAKTDVLIIGGGMAGVLCGYFLRRAGVDCVIAEGGSVGGGVTKNTTAKITAQHGLFYARLLQNAGAEKAKAYLDANQAAVEKFKELAGEIPCSLEIKPSFVYSTSQRNAGNEIEREVRAVNRLGTNAKLVQKIPLPFKTAGAVMFEGQAQFNPLEFLYGAARGLTVYQDTFVERLRLFKEHPRNIIAVTNRGLIKARRVIIATHFPFLNKYGGYFLKMYQHRSYVLALANAGDVNGMYLGASNAGTGLSFRNYGELLLIGGGGHRTGEHRSEGGWDSLRQFARRHYPNAVEKYAWASQDCMTLDGVPYIGQYSGSTPDIYVATGFNKWGMSGSMTAAMVLTAMLTGQKSRHFEVFSPQRNPLKPQLAFNAAKAVVNLLTPSQTRCPHMGCALKWNPSEGSWDCPCHGSRFSKDGGVIDNPAMRGLYE